MSAVEVPAGSRALEVERVRQGARILVDTDGTSATVEQVHVRHDAYGAELYSLVLDGGRVTQDIERGRVVFLAERA